LTGLRGWGGLCHAWDCCWSTTYMTEDEDRNNGMVHTSCQQEQGNYVSVGFLLNL